MGAVKRRAATWLRHFGYDVRRVQSRAEWQWADHVQPISARRNAQTPDDARALAEKYRAPVFGPVTVWELLERLGQCVDEADQRLGLVSQLVHALQVVEAMEADGVEDPDMLVTALIHDVGKVLVLAGEDAANVGGGTSVIASAGPGLGLDRCTLLWGADEFAYARLEGHVPDHVAWLVRYHSLDVVASLPYMDERDVRYVDAYLTRFQQYDDPSKSWSHLPGRRLEDYRGLIEEWFPEPILF